MTTDFYVGYEPEAPPALRRFLRIKIPLLLVALAGIAVAAAALQPPFAPSRFEFGVERKVDGVVYERPYPMLAVPEAGGWHFHVLAGEGKHGAAGLTRGLEGRRVRAAGALARRGSRTLVELHGAPTLLERALPLPPADTVLGKATFEGELVDGKCWLGVMNPGEGPTHRACAERCLSGGAPPLLAVRGTDGRLLAFLLMQPDGGPLGREMLGHAGEALRVTGLVVRRGDLLMLATEPSTWERVP